MNYKEERGVHGVAHRSEPAATDEDLLERAVGEARPLPTEAHSLLRPQQNRNAVWRWHVRKRQPRS